jgi:acyl-CoA synthetase (AMP-forming)/AMP-acid ligase II
VSTAAPDPLQLYADSAPDRPAVIEGDAVTTYAELNREVNRLVNGLTALGVREGEVAVWCGPNSREVIAFMHAARKLGLMAVPLAYRFTPDEMAYVIDNSGAALVMVDVEQAPLVAELDGRVPKVREVVVHRGAHAGFRTWDSVLALGTDEEPPPSGAEGLGATMIYTSGTTGKPKGARRTRTDRDLVFALLQELRMGLDEVHLTTGPLYHSGPNAFALLSMALGGTVVVMRKFDAREWVRLVREHRVTSTFSAPTQLKRIVSLPDDVLAQADCSSMRTLIANAAPVPYALKQEVIEKLGDGFLFEVYGSTELGVDTVLRPEDQLRKPGSCGRPYGHIQLKVVDEAGRDCPPGEPGELYIRTTLAMDGYHETPEQLNELEPAGSGGKAEPAGSGGKAEPAGSGAETWKSVGDVARIDDEGFVYICDRKKDMIISGGMNIYPAEIEAVLHAHPDVMDAAVFGVPDEEWGEKVHAVVQPRAGREIDVAALESFVNDRLSGYKRPRSWELRDELPRTESGKLLKRLLRDEHWSGRASKV